MYPPSTPDCYEASHAAGGQTWASQGWIPGYETRRNLWRMLNLNTVDGTSCSHAPKSVTRAEKLQNPYSYYGLSTRREFRSLMGYVVGSERTDRHLCARGRSRLHGRGVEPTTTLPLALQRKLRRHQRTLYSYPSPKLPHWYQLSQ